MATNEIYKFGDWISLPLAEGTDDPTRNGDPVIIGGIVGVAQEVGGVETTFTLGTSTTVTQVLHGNSLEPGFASVALNGAWAFEIANATTTAIGTRVNITAGDTVNPATLAFGAGGDKLFGYLIGVTSDDRAIVNIVQS